MDFASDWRQTGIWDIYENGEKCFISVGGGGGWVSLGDQTLTTVTASGPSLPWTMIPDRPVRQTSKNGLMGWHLYKDSFIEGVSFSGSATHLRNGGER